MTSPALPRAGAGPARTALLARPGGVPVGLALGLCAAAAIAVVGLFPLDRLPFSVCLFKAVTGLPCLTCGTTRALGRLVRLDLAGALAMNPLTTLGIFGLVPWALADLALLPWGRAVSLDLSPGAARVARITVVAAALANWAWLVVAGR